MIYLLTLRWEINSTNVWWLIYSYAKPETHWFKGGLWQLLKRVTAKHKFNLEDHLSRALELHHFNNMQSFAIIRYRSNHLSVFFKQSDIGLFSDFTAGVMAQDEEIVAATALSLESPVRGDNIPKTTPGKTHKPAQPFIDKEKLLPANHQYYCTA